jgi:hypothetical protein
VGWGGAGGGRERGLARGTSEAGGCYQLGDGGSISHRNSRDGNRSSRGATGHRQVRGVRSAFRPCPYPYPCSPQMPRTRTHTTTQHAGSGAPTGEIRQHRLLLLLHLLPTTRWNQVRTSAPPSALGPSGSGPRARAPVLGTIGAQEERERRERHARGSDGAVLPAPKPTSATRGPVVSFAPRRGPPTARVCLSARAAASAMRGRPVVSAQIAEKNRPPRREP